MTDAAIVLDHLGVHYGGEQTAVHAVADVGLSIADNEFVAVIGPSGCGKSTLLKVICGLLNPSSGTATVYGQTTAAARQKHFCGLVFQEPALLPWCTVDANIRLVAEMVNRRANVSELVELVGLSGFERNYPHELSGGMQQRVGLCRALAFDPPILLMDEPFAALDLLTREVLGDELLRIWETRRKTVLFVTHSISEAVLLADRVVVLSPRPARIVDVVTVDLPRPRSPGIQDSAEFAALVRGLKSTLRAAQSVA